MLSTWGSPGIDWPAAPAPHGCLVSGRGLGPRCRIRSLAVGRWPRERQYRLDHIREPLGAALRIVSAIWSSRA